MDGIIRIQQNDKLPPPLPPVESPIWHVSNGKVAFVVIKFSDTFVYESSDDNDSLEEFDYFVRSVRIVYSKTLRKIKNIRSSRGTFFFD